MRKYIEKLSLPKDVLENKAIVNIVCNDKLVINNYKSIIYYTDKKIELLCIGKTIKITGERLKIKSANRYRVSISGNIREIVFGGVK